MVLAYSHRISRVLCYSGIWLALLRFRLRGYHPVSRPFPEGLHLPSQIHIVNPKPQKCFHPWFGLMQFRSPLLPQSFVYFLFLHLLRCFSSVGSPHCTMDSCNDNTVLTVLSFLIRTSAGHRLCAPHRGLSQLITSFIGAKCQGIPYMLFVALSLDFLAFSRFLFPINRKGNSLFFSRLCKLFFKFALIEYANIVLHL